MIRNGIDERTKLSDQYQVEKQRSKNKTVGEAFERLIHPFHHAAKIHANISGNLYVGNDFVDGA